VHTRRIKMKFDVCTDMVYRNTPTSVAMRKLKNIGITAYEFWSWWDKDIAEIVETQDKLGMKCVAILAPPASLVDPAQRPTYVGYIKSSVNAAQKRGANVLIAQTGPLLPDVPRDRQIASIVDGLSECVTVLEGTGVVLNLEPLNLFDHPGYFLVRSDEAFDIVKKVGSDSVKVLFDIYHQQISEGNLIYNITKNIEHIGHFHSAGNPGRGNITQGEISYADVFKAIKETGYSKFVGLEGEMPDGLVDESLIAAHKLFESVNA
jgi:hydroxypyruvate isomerase